MVGITETYDPCFVSDWDKKLLDANIIISKELTDDMIEKLVANQDKIIFHHTVTGLGETVYEPNVRRFQWECDQIWLWKWNIYIYIYIYIKLDLDFYWRINMKTKQIHCKLCNSPLVSYLLQGSVYKFACGARECVDGRKSLGIRPMACKIIESLGGYKHGIEDEGQVEIPFPKTKPRAK